MTLCKGVLIDDCVKCSHLLVVQRDAALFNQSLCLCLGRSQTGLDQQVCHSDRTVFVQVCCTQLGGRHILTVAAGNEQRFGSVQRLLCFLGSVYHLGQRERQLFFCHVQLCAFPVLEKRR